MKTILFRKPHIHHLFVLTMFVLLANKGFNAEVFWDDFSDGNAQDGTPVRWTPTTASAGLGTLDASSGDYVFTPTPPQAGRFMVAAALDFVLTDTSIRTQGRATGINDSFIIEARRQASSDGQNYFGGMGYFPDEGGTVIFLGRADLGANTEFFGGLPVLPFDVRVEDAILQLDVIGNRLELRAWRPGEPKPSSPQLTAIDNTYQSGTVWIAGGTKGTTTFRYVHVADEPLTENPLLVINNGPAEGEAILSWVPVAESYVPLEAPSLAGPWTPTLAPILLVDGRNQVAVTTSESAQFYQLTLGQQFTDDFNDGNADGWEQHYLDPCQTSLSRSVISEAYSIEHGVPFCPGNDGFFFGPLDPSLVISNLSASVDLIDWSSSPNITFFFRGDVVSVSDGYLAGLSLNSSAFPGYSSLWFLERSPGVNDTFGIERISHLEPGNHYRLHVSVVGTQFTLRLFELSDPPILLGTTTFNDDTLSQGAVALWYRDGQPTGHITIDNFIVTGTTP